MSTNDETDTTAGADLPGTPASLWLETTPGTDFDPLDGDRRVETAVVGGGIAGITTAALLAEAGHDVAVVEANRVVEGVTGHTTAKLTSQHGLKYAKLASNAGRERARAYAEANQAALAAVADRVDADGIDCDFERRPAYIYVRSKEEVSKLQREAAAARSLGLPASYTEETPLPFDVAGAVRFDDQAQFHPRKYLLALAESIPEHGGRVFERTRATDVRRGRRPRVETERGTIAAEHVVVASHFPFVDPALYFARAHPMQSHVLAVRIAEEPPTGLFYRTETPHHSLRTHPTEDGELVVVGGETHKTGQGDSVAARYRRLAQFARATFDVEEIVYRWTTQDYESVDGVPFVGPAAPGARNVHVATGFGGWGMTNGTAAGMMLADRILGRENEWADAFDPRRLAPRASTGEFLRQNANAAGEFVGDWARKPRAGDPDALRPGEARVMRHDGDVLAAHRDEDGDLHAVSAVCTHLRCLVAWNDGERTWDCPCHGSRFDPDGRVIDGPANDDLPRRDP